MISLNEFKNLFKGSNLEITDKQYAQFEKYCQLLQEWNQKMNLTAITEDGEVAEKHFLDSLLPINLAEFKKGSNVIDIGTGAGFPGLPMKIYRPDLEITLLDPLNKRLLFLEEVCKQIEVEAKRIHLRAEEAGAKTEFREKYDVAVSRAVAQLGLLAEYCLPLVKIGGQVLALKGNIESEELDAAGQAIEKCGGKLEKIEKYQLPKGDNRTLIVIQKIKETPKQYPRTTSKIGKTPIK